MNLKSLNFNHHERATSLQLFVDGTCNKHEYSNPTSNHKCLDFNYHERATSLQLFIDVTCNKHE